MPINVITESSWDRIIEIQEEAYVEVPAEDVTILKSKWLAPPKTCTVYLNDNGNILAYLLAHPWTSDIPPKLHETISISKGSTLYIHDLALTQEAKGKNIAKKLVENLISHAKAQGFSKVLLVAVQNSNEFWAKFGFVNITNTAICSSYGNNAQLMTLKLQE